MKTDASSYSIRRMTRLFLCASLAFSVHAFAQETPPPVHEKNSAAENDEAAKKQETAPAPVSGSEKTVTTETSVSVPPPASEREDLLKSMNIIFSEIEKESPALYRRIIRSTERAKILSGLLESMDSGVILYENGAKKTAPEKNAPPAEKKAYAAKRISSERILYIRMDDLNTVSFDQLKKDCEAIEKQPEKKPLGIVIDLRNATGSDYRNALRELSIFCPPERLPHNMPKVEGDKRFFDLPVMLLVGYKTSGSAEIFASLMEKTKQGLTLGGTTAGKPFELKEVKSCGFTLMIPLVPDGLDSVEPEKLKPSVEIEPYPQADYEKLGTNGASENKDRCLLRATDLLLSLDALKNKWSK